jgi:ATP-dependent DNA helicase RecG
MSATPIPQTLALTLFGDMDISVIDTLPQGRKPIITHLAKIGNAEKVYSWIDKEITKGHQAYFVYPVIEGTEDTDLKSAQAMADQLATRYGSEQVALLHSKVLEESKKAIMLAFGNGTIKVLVATSVVEVGVDVANATCMVIEHAERFGMAALHQLRGRVGRSHLQSYCFLVYSEPLSTLGKERLLALKASNDGFYLAEKDLEIRGPGDLIGATQSGYLRLRIADLLRDASIMLNARSDVQGILSSDPTLTTPEHSALRQSLQLDFQAELL